MFPTGTCCQPVRWPGGDGRGMKSGLGEENGVPCVTLLKGMWTLQLLLLLLPLTLLLPLLPPSLLFSSCHEVNSSALRPRLCYAALPSQNATDPSYCDLGHLWKCEPPQTLLPSVDCHRHFVTCKLTNTVSEMTHGFPKKECHASLKFKYLHHFPVKKTQATIAIKCFD